MKKKLFAGAILASILTAALGMLHQGYPPSGRLYVAMPGLLIGLLLGFSTGSQLVIPPTILANAITYYGIVRGILLLRRKKDADKPSPAR